MRFRDNKRHIFLCRYGSIASQLINAVMYSHHSSQWVNSCIAYVVLVDDKNSRNNKTKKSQVKFISPPTSSWFLFSIHVTRTCTYTCAWKCTCTCTCTCTHPKSAIKTPFFGWRVGQSYSMSESVMALHVSYSSAEARLDAPTDHRSVTYPIYTHVDDSLMHGCIYLHCDDCCKANNHRVAFQCADTGTCLG